MARVLCLSSDDVAAVLTLEACIPAVERAFASYALKRSQVFPVIREQVPGTGGIFGVKSGYDQDQGWLGLKAGGFWAENRARGLPAHQSVIVVFDPATGVVRAIVDANVITRLRTGAVGAIAARALAPRSASVAAVIGCGVQGEIQTRALQWALPHLQEVRCADPEPASVRGYLDALGDLDLYIRAVGTAEEAVRGADVIVTTTPSWKPVIADAWVGTTVHISAVGADTKGKQELDPAIFKRARVVVDDWIQAREIGESQHAYRLGWLTRDTLYAELGDLCAGSKSGRGDFDGVTIFDATGIALQDLAAAGLAMDLASARGIGQWVEI
ncbi:MAG: ornithine cyclodeaminase family protein [Armatimonadota bacterium]|nr:ornithine cyclodeaminase family protein [Armatimonadota bacterium]